MQQHTADSSRKKKRRRRNDWLLQQLSSSSSSTRSAAAAQEEEGGGGGEGQCCCSHSHSQSQGHSRQLMIMSPPLLLLALLLIQLVPTPLAFAASPRRMARIQSHLDRINKPAVRSIRSSDGDTIDCVAAQSQHGLEHPLLEGHAIQTEPPEVPTGSRGGAFFRRFPAAAAADGASTTNLTNKQLQRTCWQTWHHGGHCPPGTVAIRRTTAEDVLRAGSVARFGRKQKKKRRFLPLDYAALAADAPDVVSGNGHEGWESPGCCNQTEDGASGRRRPAAGARPRVRRSGARPAGGHAGGRAASGGQMRLGARATARAAERSRGRAPLRPRADAVRRRADVLGRACGTATKRPVGARAVERRRARVLRVFCTPAVRRQLVFVAGDSVSM